MIFLENPDNQTLNLALLESIADTLTQRDIELVICDDAAIRTLNRQYRQIDKATDVLSFPLEGDLSHQPLGTIVISYEHARRKADELGHAPQDEFALLFTHGLLHLLGYDHETDRGEMRALEHTLMHRFGLPESLIIRTEES